jgi:ferredoxin
LEITKEKLKDFLKRTEKCLAFYDEEEKKIREKIRDIELKEGRTKINDMQCVLSIMVGFLAAAIDERETDEDNLRSCLGWQASHYCKRPIEKCFEGALKIEEIKILEMEGK